MTCLRDLMPAPTEIRQNGETHYPCPQCGGHDRFLVRPDGARGYCRHCQWQPDAIQYLREIEGLSFRQAAHAVGKEIAERPYHPALAARTRALRRAFQGWREQMWMRAYQRITEARGRLLAAADLQAFYHLAPSTFSAAEKQEAATALLDAEIDFQDAQAAFLALSPKDGDEETALGIWADRMEAADVLRRMT